MSCTSQNEHIDIKKVANRHVRVNLKRRRKCQKIYFSYFSSSSSHLFCPGSFSGTTIDTSISNIPLEPLWHVGLTFYDIGWYCVPSRGSNPPKRLKQGREWAFSSHTCKTLQELIRRWNSERELFNDDIAHTQAYFKIPEKRQTYFV